jgi:hypothetical protein
MMIRHQQRKDIMRSINVGLALASAAVVLAAAACSPTEPQEVTEVIVVSGDSQVVAVDGIVGEPIEVEIRTASGKPRAYAPLYWTIGRLEGGTVVAAGRIVEAYASADRHGRATGEFQVAEAGIYKVEAVAKRYTDANGQEVKVSAVATIIVPDPPIEE